MAAAISIDYVQSYRPTLVANYDFVKFTDALVQFAWPSVYVNVTRLQQWHLRECS